NATLVVTSSNGDTASTTRANAVRNAEGNLPPTVRCEITYQTGNRRIPDGENATLQGLLPLSVLFDASSSADSDGAIAMYRWDFDGDGQIDYEDNLPTIEYTFTEHSTFNVRLTVEDNKGGLASKNATVIVTNGD